jgi:hypothetical protein
MIEEESLAHGTSKSYVINMESKESTQFQGLHSKMELLRGRIDQYSKCQDQ